MLNPKIALVLLLLSASAWADCADDYGALLEKARAEKRGDDVLELLNAAVAECPRYGFWQELGEASAQRGSLNEEVRQQAAIAFDNAFALASSDAERARSVARYAKLLLDSGDPQRAEPRAYFAKNLSDEPWIRELCEQIDRRISLTIPADIQKAEAPTPLTASIIENFFRSRGPNVPQAAVPSGKQESAPSLASSRQPASAPSSQPASDPGAKPVEVSKSGTFRVNINFMSNSAEVDRETSGNIEKLANLLVDPRYSNRMFVFTGHTDKRGDPSSNHKLSRARAAAVLEKVIRLQPSLEGRIGVMGRGADDLYARGSSEADHRANRRLMVLWVE